MYNKFLKDTDITEFLKKTWEERTDFPFPDIFNDPKNIPSFVIRDLFYSDNFEKDNFSQFSFSGKEYGLIENIITSVGKIRIASRADLSILEDLGIPHAKILNCTNNHKDLIRDAIEYLNKLNPYYAKSVIDYCGTVFWIKVPEDYKESYPPITSASYPALPFATFISDLAMKHVAPIEFIETPRSYALGENLFHESLHQELTFLILSKNILSKDFFAKKNTDIYIPWRNTYWAIDRVLHATYVYTNLIPFRIDAANYEKGEISEQLNVSANEGKNILYLLANLLNENLHFFSNEGKDLVNNILKMAEKSIGVKVLS